MAWRHGRPPPAAPGSALRQAVDNAGSPWALWTNGRVDVQVKNHGGTIEATRRRLAGAVWQPVTRALGKPAGDPRTRETEGREQMDAGSDGRFPRSVYGQGSEPDARFSLANERTFLAWVSTALALLSVGIGLESLAVSLAPGYRRAAAVLLIVTGMTTPVLAWFAWARAEAALRKGEPLPPPHLAPWIAASLFVAGLLVLAGVFAS